MKVAVVYNREKKGIINVLGMQNREWYPEETILKVVNALEKKGHTVEMIVADRNLLARLNKFLPKLSKRQAPGIVFNLALGVQGKCRYTHVPAILEVAGIPYTGSSPLGHTLALDKVVAKQILMASGLPTPNYRIFTDPDQTAPELQFPIIVKPRGEAAGLGLKVVTDEESLKEAVIYILEEYKQSALVEEFIEGREVNVSILGNEDPRPFPILEVVFEAGEDTIYTYEHKFSRKRRITKVCPASLPQETAAYIQKVAVQAYGALNIYDYGRIDIRLDRYNQPHILEMNSMASVNPGSSFVRAAKAAGFTYDQLINKILDVTIKRYALEEPEFFGPENEEAQREFESLNK